jgi:hypothetical protein
MIKLLYSFFKPKTLSTMKFFLTFFAAFLVFSFSTAIAQDDRLVVPNTGFGVRAGVNIANFINGGTASNWNHDFIVAPMGGVYYRLGIGDRFTVQPELLYSQKGANFTPGVPGETREFSDRLHYLQLPVYAQYWFLRGFNLHIGPYASFLLGAGEDGRQGTGLEQDYRTWDFGGSAGLGYEFPFGLNIRGNYNIGVINVAGDRNNLINPNQSQPLNNQFFQVSLGWTF